MESGQNEREPFGQREDKGNVRTCAGQHQEIRLASCARTFALALPWKDDTSHVALQLCYQLAAHTARAIPGICGCNCLLMR